MNRIHSMELKVTQSNHKNKNPHNHKRIHSMELKGNIVLGALARSVTSGIHSMELKADMKRHGMTPLTILSGIHSMELKVT